MGFKIFPLAYWIFILPQISFADVKAAGVAPYGIDTTGSLYYASSATSTSTATDASISIDTASGYKALTATTDSANNIKVAISADGISSGTGVTLSVFAGTTDSPTTLIPISTVNNQACSSSFCTTPTNCPVGYYCGFSYGSANPENSVEIGLNLKQMCEAQSANLGTSICTGTGTSANYTFPPYGYLNSNLKVRFAVTTTAATDTSTGVNVNVKVEKTVPTTGNCGGNNPYFPGDSEIELAVSQFSGSSSGAPVDTLMFLARDGGTPYSTASTLSQNDIVARIPLSSSTYKVTGFKNTSNGSDHQYSVLMGVRDTAGSLSAFTCATNWGKVQTATIQGFLSKGNCFIATAAHRSTDAWGVQILRQFRDQFLHHYSWGRAFTAWYYKNSPQAANWLMENPEYRWPVLAVLVPLEGVIWVYFHPYLALFFVIIIGLFLVRKKEHLFS